MQQHPQWYANNAPDKPALILPDTGETLSYSQMMSGANRIARLFQRMGVKPRDTVAFYLENHLIYPQLCWAAENSGLHYVCIGSNLNAADAAYIVDNSDAKVLVTSHAKADVAKALVAKLSRPIALLMCDGAVPPFAAIEDAMRAETDEPLQGQRRGSVLLYSSGTTGRPKGIKPKIVDASPETPQAFHPMLRQFGLANDGVVLNPGPFYHSTPLRFMMHGQREGATIVGFRKFDAEAVLRSIEQHRATVAVLVPTMMVRMLKLPADIRGAVDVSSLRFVLHQAAPIAIHTKQMFIDWVGPIVYDLYGGSEANGSAAISSKDWLLHKGSVGKPTPDTQVQILDEAGRECPRNTPGLIYLWNGNVFEYLNDPGKTAEVRNAQGWSTLGDIGYLDDEGYLYLTDRQSNMVISGGVNIYPQESENVLIAHPDVFDVAVFGVPNEDFGEELMAVVVPMTPLGAGRKKAFAEELIRFCRDALSPIKCPRRLEIVESIPRSEAGKILKRDLKLKYARSGGGT